MIKFPVQLDIFRRQDGRLQRVEHLSLPEPGYYAIGRLPDNEIQLEARQVSREHALIQVSREGMKVADRGSTNGTFIGDGWHGWDDSGQDPLGRPQPRRLQPAGRLAPRLVAAHRPHRGHRRPAPAGRLRLAGDDPDRDRRPAADRLRG